MRENLADARFSVCTNGGDTLYTVRTSGAFTSTGCLHFGDRLAAPSRPVGQGLEVGGRVELPHGWAGGHNERQDRRMVFRLAGQIAHDHPELGACHGILPMKSDNLIPGWVEQRLSEGMKG